MEREVAGRIDLRFRDEERSEKDLFLLFRVNICKTQI
jgi:hypothetical protein